MTDPRTEAALPAGYVTACEDVRWDLVTGAYCYPSSVWRYRIQRSCWDESIGPEGI